MLKSLNVSLGSVGAVHISRSKGGHIASPSQTDQFPQHRLGASLLCSQYKENGGPLFLLQLKTRVELLTLTKELAARKQRSSQILPNINHSANRDQKEFKEMKLVWNQQNSDLQTDCLGNND